MNEDIVNKIKKYHLFNDLVSGKEILYDSKIDKWIVTYECESITKRLENKWLKFCKDNNILNEYILIIDCNLTNRNRKNIYGYNYFLNQCKKLLNEYSEYGITDYKLIKNKRYNCFNNAPRDHRKVLFNLLKDNDLLKCGIVSYRMFSWDTNDDFYYKEEEPIFLDEMNSEDSWNDFRWFCFNKNYVDETYFNVVTESYPDWYEGFNDYEHQDLMITEKTCKALISQPFIVLGNYGTLKKLREWGFKTYPEFFDESYDLIESGDERIKFIFNEVKRLCNMDIEELKDKYKSVIWKIKYNRNIMKNFKEDKFINELKSRNTSLFESENYIEDNPKDRQHNFNELNSIK